MRKNVNENYDADYCYECEGYGDDYKIDKNGELTCCCDDCPMRYIEEDECFETAENAIEDVENETEIAEDYDTEFWVNDDLCDDPCYECGGYGDDFYVDESGELVCACDDCPFNLARRDEE